jgi:hypothetical protein
VDLLVEAGAGLRLVEDLRHAVVRPLEVGLQGGLVEVLRAADRRLLKCCQYNEFLKICL